MFKIRIGVRGGHNFKCTGAVGIIDETTEDRKVHKAVVKYLEQLGHEVIDCTPKDTPDQFKDLSDGVDKANYNNVDLFISIHFNKAYNSYSGAIGSEVYYYSKDYKGAKYACKIVDSLMGLGFRNRGIKTNDELYEMQHTNMTAILVEVCFVEATEDVALYKKLGADMVGKTIAEAITGKKIENKLYRVQVGAFSDKDNAEKLLKELQNKGYKGFII